ncbi:MAG: Wzz/FepE/Etk N-terminal domain-containing protein [Pelagimonas sp.]|jgi:uncharacterized protein involved in exopolysaccharide biosynthesis|nr:Wzz/FepE/Etk N-terminal domain-containing protein [Pelagimonas sp.]
MNQFQSAGEILSAFKRRFWIIFAILIAGAVLSVQYALNQKKLYEATAVVQIEDASVPEALVAAGARTEEASRAVRLIEQRLMSRDNLLRLISEYQLFPEANHDPLAQRLSVIRSAIGIEKIRDQAQRFTPGGSTPSALLINVRLSDPEKAAAIANDLMNSVIEQSRNRNAARAREALAFFTSEEKRVGAEIETLEAEISDFKQANAQQLPAGLQDLRTQLTQLDTADLDLDRELIALGSSSGRQRQDSNAREEALLREQKMLIAERVAEIQAILEGGPEVERELNRLERELTKLQEQYTVITSRKADAEMGQALEVREHEGRFQVLEEALVPEVSVSRSRKKIVMMGVIVSGALGLLVAFIVEMMNPAIRTASQLERSLGVTPVVTIPVIEQQGTSKSAILARAGKIGLAVIVLLAAVRLISMGSPWISDLVSRFGGSVSEG